MTDPKIDPIPPAPHCLDEAERMQLAQLLATGAPALDDIEGRTLLRAIEGRTLLRAIEGRTMQRATLLQIRGVLAEVPR